MTVVQTALLIVIIGILLRDKMPSKPKEVTASGVVVDSCGLIDGRIVQLVELGYLQGPIIIPAFVLQELQLLADGADAQKRERARFGLDVAHDVQKSTAEVVVDEYMPAGRQTTDEKLVALALDRKARLYTTDYNLNKVAAVSGVQVLNIHDLAKELRPPVLPGEERQVTILQRGTNPQQGVGYMEDGSMVVVGGAAHVVGKTVQVVIKKMHQTSAGKMIFAELRNGDVKAQTQARTVSSRFRMKRHRPKI